MTNVVYVLRETLSCSEERRRGGARQQIHKKHLRLLAFPLHVFPFALAPPSHHLSYPLLPLRPHPFCCPEMNISSSAPLFLVISCLDRYFRFSACRKLLFSFVVLVPPAVIISIIFLKSAVHDHDLPRFLVLSASVCRLVIIPSPPFMLLCWQAEWSWASMQADKDSDTGSSVSKTKGRKWNTGIH